MLNGLITASISSSNPKQVQMEPFAVAVCNGSLQPSTVRLRPAGIPGLKVTCTGKESSALTATAWSQTQDL